MTVVIKWFFLVRKQNLEILIRWKHSLWKLNIGLYAAIYMESQLECAESL